jgi:predicted acyltransferase (DUF342 family)
MKNAGIMTKGNITVRNVKIPTATFLIDFFLILILNLPELINIAQSYCNLQETAQRQALAAKAGFGR